MKKVLLLGAGLVSNPLVQYLLEQGYSLTVASRTVSKAEALVKGHPNGTALALNVKDGEALDNLVGSHDLTISLLPYTFHLKVAEASLKHKKPMVTTSYVSAEMDALDNRAKEAGILILNECGLDPGIDHMSAMKIIHKAEAEGGKIIHFRSFCGGLPAPEANDNPFGYKFSGSPKGVLMAGRNNARFLEDGEVKEIPGKILFDSCKMMTVPIAGEFEGYPNRDSVPYKAIYDLKDAKTVLRGTLRNQGWCKTLKKISDLGLVTDDEQNFQGKTYADVLRDLVGAGKDEDLRSATALKVGLPKDHPVLDRLDWLGLFSDDAIPIESGGTIDMMTARMIEKMSFTEDERDMIVLNHDFEVHYSDRKERITSTMVDYGIPGGDSSMARTVSLPAAIATRMILEGQIADTGVLIPIKPSIYNPILDELETMNIKMVEETTIL